MTNLREGRHRVGVIVTQRIHKENRFADAAGLFWRMSSFDGFVNSDAKFLVMSGGLGGRFKEFFVDVVGIQGKSGGFGGIWFKRWVESIINAQIYRKKKPKQRVKVVRSESFSH
ncbi:unnamed protein product [Ilex paraguariensis]|uniref:Uncharacterized protein n=1 Tax=Ilex paraguariensis TaxID=185542 RepID=A0ABC8SMF1_9AQUA